MTKNRLLIRSIYIYTPKYNEYIPINVLNALFKWTPKPFSNKLDFNIVSVCFVYLFHSSTAQSRLWFHVHCFILSSTEHDTGPSSFDEAWNCWALAEVCTLLNAILVLLSMMDAFMHIPACSPGIHSGQLSASSRQFQPKISAFVRGYSQMLLTWI